jgi:beta-glucosidase
MQVGCTPRIQYTDGPSSVVSGAGPGITAFPAQIGLAATWNLALTREKGAAYAWEAFYKQRNVVLAPGLASGRTPLSGRNNEYFGEDPLLSGLLAAANIRGIEDDTPPDVAVQANLKHYLANEQELDRQTSSSNMDERTLMQIYVLPWEIAIKEGDPGSVMCSFNQVNGIWACENGFIQNTILKQYIGFQGWIVSDFGSVHSTAQSLIGGLDQELNRPRFYSPANLKAALSAGQITEAQIDAAAFRIVSAHIEHGLFDVPRPAASLPDVSSPEHRAIARRVVEEGAVLLKNDGVLPLNGSGKTIAVIGPTASNIPTQGISAASVCSAITPNVPCTPVAPLDAITERAAQTGNTVVFDDGTDLAAAAATAQNAQVAIVFGYYRAGEFNDRTNINLDGNGDALIAAVAAANPNTIVILQTGGPVLMPWVNQVKGVLEVWYAGVEMGNAITRLLWGDVNPSGKLPQTFPVAATDLPTANSTRRYPGIFSDGSTTRPPGTSEIRQVYYDEGMLVGYRWFDNQGIQPLFPFGHGLSYTTFAYSNMQVTPRKVQSDKEIRVNFRVTNNGPVAGTEVAQVYLSLPGGLGEPPKRLVGWERVTLQPGEHVNLSIRIDPNSSAHPLSYWDASSHVWKTSPGNYTFMAGASSRNLPLTDTIAVWTK